MMDLAISLGRTWFVDHIRSFVILHEDQPMMDCKFFREDLVCEILFDSLLGVRMQGQIRGGGGVLGVRLPLFS